MLVTGGLVATEDNLRVLAIGTAEVVAYGGAAMWNPCPASLLDGGVATLPPPRSDSGPPDPPDAGPDPDAAAGDAGVASMDAGF